MAVNERKVKDGDVLDNDFHPINTHGLIVLEWTVLVEGQLEVSSIGG